jgi:hypothetical protein
MDKMHTSNTCDEPCRYENRCRFCEAYWQRMVGQNLWDPQRNCWTIQAFRVWVR